MDRVKWSHRKAYGVSYNAKMDKWYGEIMIEGFRWRKAFDTEEEALEYRCKLEQFRDGEINEEEIA